ncbi:bifunctional DNA primase/polymerase-like protein, partial [Murinocardiopsis flavida]
MAAHTMLDYATAAARRGWPVFPIRPRTKHPLVRGWEQAATTEQAQIHTWWKRVPTANVGIACGPANLVVVDLDVPKPGERTPSRWAAEPGIRDGADVFAALAEAAGERIDLGTFLVRTRRGGLHLYYTAPPGTRLGNTSGERGNGLGWLIDTRGAGGYVVGPGSYVADEDGEGAYEVVAPTDLAPLPAWIADRLTPAPAVSEATAELEAVAAATTRRGAYAAAALRGEVDKIRAAPQGQRNTSVYIAAKSLGQLAARGLLDTEQIRAALHAAGQAAGLPEQEVT